MSHPQQTTLLPALRRMALSGDAGDITDGQLLDCYLKYKEESAIRALVHRHGPMVMGVCQRMLRDSHDAEDAFQATFLVLVRKAETIRPRNAVGNWLYGVAYRTAKEARRKRAKRRLREEPSTAQTELTSSSVPSPVGDVIWRDLRAVLDQELSRLPERYRTPIILCDIEGKSRKLTAQQLGCPEGSLSGWLTRGREMLRKRLARRGVTLSAGALSGALASSSATGAVPPVLVGSTVQAGLALAGGTAAGAAVSGSVLTLVSAVVKGMIMSKGQLVAVLALGIAVTGGGVGLLSLKTVALEQSDNKPKSPSRNEQTQRLPYPKMQVVRTGNQAPSHLSWSPNGRSIVGITSKGEAEFLSGVQMERRIVKSWNLKSGAESWNFDATSAGVALDFAPPVISHDGTTIAVAGVSLQAKSSAIGVALLIDARTGQLNHVLPHQLLVRGIAFHKNFGNVLTGTGGNVGRPFPTVMHWDVGTGHIRRIFETVDRTAEMIAISRDGAWLAAAVQPSTGPREILLWDIMAGKIRHKFKNDNWAGALVFSRDFQTLMALSAKEEPKGQLNWHLKKWRVDTGKIANTTSHPVHTGIPTATSFSDDGGLLAIASKNVIQLWKIENGKLKGSIGLQNEEVKAIAFSPDNRFLAISAGNNTIKIADLTLMD